MTKDKAIYVLKNTAWLGSEEDLAKVERAINVLQIECDVAYTKGFSDGVKHCSKRIKALFGGGMNDE